VSYAPKRPHISKKTRALIFEREKGLCWICQQKIMAGEEWHADHQLARELGGSDDASNLFPAHVQCHRLKSKEDVKLIAKGNRIRQKAGLDPIRRKARPKIPQRPNPWPKGQKFPKR
jgi:5-methylcytosine-specific restriction endonuclease McrA